jgi:hypothetical protein
MFFFKFKFQLLCRKILLKNDYSCGSMNFVHCSSFGSDLVRS